MDKSGVRHTGTAGILTGMKGKGHLMGSHCVSIAMRQNRRGEAGMVMLTLPYGLTC